MTEQLELKFEEEPKKLEKTLENRCYWKYLYENREDDRFKCTNHCEGYDFSCNGYFKPAKEMCAKYIEKCKASDKNIIVKSHDGKTTYHLKDGAIKANQNLAFEYFGNGRKKQ